MPSSPPVRTLNTAGHEVAKVAPLPVSTSFRVAAERLGVPLTANSDGSQSAVVGLYTLTHAFLI
jgi:hypothetical protein